MLFPTIRFALFFVAVMPVSWLLMPLPGRYRSAVDRDQPWLPVVGLAAAALLLGPLAPSDGWPVAPRVVLGLAALALAALAVIRLIDALKTFDTIYVITLGGPGTASETINILLYQTAFAYYDLGYGSAMVVVFFVLILLISLLLLRIRQREDLR